VEGSAVHIENLNFRYKGQAKSVLNDLSLKISVKDRFGLFGPNGAGKTTLMSIMTGLLPYSEGTVKILGREVSKEKKEINKVIGFVPQDFSFYHELSPVENLDFFGAWSGLNKREIKTKTDELLEVLGLADVKDKQVKKFSGGMKRRVNLAIAVIHEPEIIFLDEPTVGVDVQTRYAIINYLKYLNQKGATLVYTSHQLGEAEDLCQKIAMIDEGTIIAQDSLDRMLSHHQQDGLEGLFLNLTGRAYRD
jgi:ABC-2 type transport system ATP-binding protein